MAYGPCGMQFREAFSCFVFSEEEPKGIDCVEKFKAMQDCFRENPDVYGEGTHLRQLPFLSSSTNRAFFFLQSEILSDDDDDEESPALSPSPNSGDAVSASPAGPPPESPSKQVSPKPA
jgi:intermembrane space import and assembly protein 40